MNNSMRVFANIGIIIALYYFTYYTFLGVTYPIPAPGDSWDYHIPISQSILNRSFLQLPHVTVPQRFYPGSSEAINSILLLLHIPLTLSNIFAMLVLIVCLYKLARCFRLQPYYSLLYALTFITLNAVVRWQNAVSIDVWVAVFFTLGVILLEKPKKTLSYFVRLGFVLGMLIGSKYTSIYFLIILLVFYGKNLFRFISIIRLLVFLIPFSIFGLFWYIRNYILKGDPFYPLPILGFKGTMVFSDNVWNQMFHHPFTMFDAAFSEYHVWIFSVLIILAAIIYQFFVQKKYKINNNTKLYLLGIINFFLFLTFPTDTQPWIMVSSFRYSFPTFIPLILGVFLLAAKYKKEEWLGYVAIANMLNVLTMAFYPKLILIYLPLSLIAIYLLNKKMAYNKSQR